jgi:hypothetical protein
MRRKPLSGGEHGGADSPGTACSRIQGPAFSYSPPRDARLVDWPSKIVQEVSTLIFDSPLTDAGGSVSIDPSSILQAYRGPGWQTGFDGYSPGALIPFNGTYPNGEPIDGTSPNVSGLGAGGNGADTPEAATMALSGFGLVGIALIGKRRLKAA